MFHKTQQWGCLLYMSIAKIKFSRQKLVAGWFSFFVRTYEWKSAVRFRLKAINSGYFWDRSTIRLKFLCWESEGAISVATSSLFGVIRSTQKITLRRVCRETCRLPPPPDPTTAAAATTTTRYTRTCVHTPLSWPYVAESKPIESIARKHDMTFQIHWASTVSGTGVLSVSAHPLPPPPTPSPPGP